METRANYVWVGAVSLLLLALLAAFIVWLAQLGTQDRKDYDIFFEQSVGGLAKGSEVTFQGVPAGQVQEIELWRQDPGFVRVRVSLDEDIPVLQGTTASISASFTGVSTISLGGAVRGAPAITEPGPEGAPVIPAEPGGLGEILASAPLLLERLATLTDRLTRLLSDENQASITGILANTDRMSAQFADMAPEMEATLVELRRTLAQSTETLDAFESTLRSTDSLLNDEGRSLAQELRATLRSAQQAATTLEATMEDVRPGAREMAQTTLPLANATLQDLRRTSEALRQMTEKIQTDGAGALVGGNKLPDYEP
ncbi:MAG TPA: MlaD family protein [Croceibacterium sp.]|nr:MlaD family protein [Croceibacterium sp.]